MKRKKVNILLTIALTIDVPEDYDSDMIEFSLNESSHCIGNEIDRLAEKVAAEEELNLCSVCAAMNVVVGTDHRLTPLDISQQDHS